MPPEWDFFLAHAAADTEVAELLYDHLHDRAAVFLDTRTLRPGDDWDVALAAAQRNSRATIILVTARTGAAYYQRDEIAAAIDLARVPSGSPHRVVPIFYGDPLDRTAVPYGLRLKHGLTVRDATELWPAALKLLDLLRDMTEVPDHLLRRRMAELADASLGDEVTLQMIADGVRLAASSIERFTRAVDAMVRSGAATVDFLTDRRERIRLRSLFAQLIRIENIQQRFPLMIRSYRENPTEAAWDFICRAVVDLTVVIAGVEELLSQVSGPFVVSAPDTYRSLLFGLRGRTEVYQQIERMARPTSAAELALLDQIAEQYERMRADLVQTRDAVWRYLTD